MASATRSLLVPTVAGLIAALLLAAPFSQKSSHAAKVYRIAVVSSPSPPPAPWLDAFRAALRELGWAERRNIVVEIRSGKLDRIDELASAVVRERFDVIVTSATPVARAMKRATATIPIVMAVASDPIRGGVVDALAAPGANVTGHTIMGPELAGKRLELLKQVVPGLSRVALGLPAGRRSEPVVIQYIDEYQAAARQIGVDFQVIEVATAGGWGAAFGRLKAAGIGAVAIPEGRTLRTQAPQITAAAIRHRVPTVHALRGDVVAGGLMSYGPDVVDLWRRSATFVDKILRGAKPADLPVEQPTKFKLVINLKTATALGLDIPPSLVTRADQIIE